MAISHIIIFKIFINGIQQLHSRQAVDRDYVEKHWRIPLTPLIK